jgi:uncharacterized integral membrane protein
MLQRFVAEACKADENGASGAVFLSCFLKPVCKGRMGATLTRSTMKNLIRYLGLAVKLLVFLVVLGFAMKNSHTVDFYSYLGYVGQAPLIVMLGLAFLLGTLTGMLALVPTLFRLRRELARKPQESERDTIPMDTNMPIV